MDIDSVDSMDSGSLNIPNFETDNLAVEREHSLDFVLGMNSGLGLNFGLGIDFDHNKVEFRE